MMRGLLLWGVALAFCGQAVQADHVDFNTPGELGQKFRQNGTVNYGEIASGGLGNSRAADALANDGTALYTGKYFNMSNSGHEVTVSMFVHRNNRTNNTWFMEVGLTAEESYQLTGTNAYMAVRLDSVNPTKYDLFSYCANGTNETSTLEANNITLSNNRWYKLTATFTNIGNNQIRVSGNVVDYGSTGVTAGATVGTVAGRTYLNSVLASQTETSAGFRAKSTGGADVLDDFTVVPEPATLSLLALSGIAMIRLRPRCRHRQ